MNNSAAQISLLGVNSHNSEINRLNLTLINTFIVLDASKYY